MPLLPFKITPKGVLVLGAFVASILAYANADLPFPQGSDEVVLQRALDLYDHGKIGDSWKLMERLARENPGNPLVWYNLGNIYFRYRKWAEAALAYEKVTSSGSPLSTPANLYRALCYRKLGNDTVAIGILNGLKHSSSPLPHAIAVEADQQLEALRITQSDGLVRRGIASYQGGELGSAYRDFQAASKLGTADDAKMMEGLTLLRAKDSVAARQIFMGIASSSANDDYRSEAQELLLQINEGIWSLDRAYFLSIDFSSGYSNNVFGYGDIGSAVSKPISDLALRTGYSFWRDKPLSLRLEYGLNWDEVISLPAYRLVTQTALGRWAYQTGGWLFEAIPSYQYQILGSETFLSKPGAEFQVEKRWGLSAAGMTYAFRRSDAPDSTFSYLSGPSQEARFYVRGSTHIFDWRAELLLSEEALGALPVNGGSIPLANYTLGPEASTTWDISRLWLAQGSAAYLYRNFQGLEAPDGIKRIDHLLSLELRLQRKLSPGLSVYAAPADVWNQSTLGQDAVVDKNYNEVLFRAGIVWTPWP